MAKGVHPVMQSIKPAAAQPRIDCVFSKAQLKQLRPRDDPMLPPCEGANLPVGRVSLRFPAYMAGNSKFTCLGWRHGRDGGRHRRAGDAPGVAFV